jgi:hypothetical protein
MRLTVTMRQTARREQRAAELRAAMRAARSDANGTDGRYFEEKRALLKSYGTG